MPLCLPLCNFSKYSTIAYVCWYKKYNVATGKTAKSMLTGLRIRDTWSQILAGYRRRHPGGGSFQSFCIVQGEKRQKISTGCGIRLYQMGKREGHRPPLSMLSSKTTWSWHRRSSLPWTAARRTGSTQGTRTSSWSADPAKQDILLNRTFMQAQRNSKIPYIVTDPKGTIIIEYEQM